MPHSWSGVQGDHKIHATLKLNECFCLNVLHFLFFDFIMINCFFGFKSSVFFNSTSFSTAWLWSDDRSCYGANAFIFQPSKMAWSFFKSLGLTVFLFTVKQQKAEKGQKIWLSLWGLGRSFSYRRRGNEQQIYIHPFSLKCRDMYKKSNFNLCLF